MNVNDGFMKLCHNAVFKCLWKNGIYNSLFIKCLGRHLSDTELKWKYKLYKSVKNNCFVFLIYLLLTVILPEYQPRIILLLFPEKNFLSVVLVHLWRSKKCCKQNYCFFGFFCYDIAKSCGGQQQLQTETC